MSLAVTLTFAIQAAWNAVKSSLTGIFTDSSSGDMRSATKNEYAYGTGFQQIANIYVNDDTLSAASGSDTIDLSIVDNPLGDACNFNKIKVLIVKNNEPAGGPTLLIGGAGSNAFSGPWNSSTSAVTPVPAGGSVAFENPAGWSVTGACKLLKLAHGGLSSGSVDYQVVALGS